MAAGGSVEDGCSIILKNVRINVYELMNMKRCDVIWNIDKYHKYISSLYALFFTRLKSQDDHAFLKFKYAFI